ncbi:Rhodanese-like domain-containing protein [Gloeopeniophorella convolvens]|nr:Rhodanese-like domain-containing protein [Gloeopeniophorella convolvens]
MTGSSASSSPTSYGVSPAVEGPFQAFHREALSVSSATTPVFSPVDRKEDDTASLRTLDDVRDQVASRLAVRAIRKLKTVDDTRYAVSLTLSKSDDAGFLRLVAAHLQRVLGDRAHLMAIATTGTGDTSLAICGTDPVQVQRAALLSTSKFMGHILPLAEQDEGGTVWLARVRELAWTAYDETALWDVLHKCAQQLADPSRPPPGSRGIDEMLAEARTRLQRVTPRQALDELQDTSLAVPVLLVDIRPAAQRATHGGIPGAMIIERNVLEWRFDPRSLDGRLDIATRYDLRVIIFCQEGYTSSLAAASLQDIGLLNATDMRGGFKAWKDEGFPVQLEP